MSTQTLIERLERIKPGIENSNSAAENAMVEILPLVIAELKRLSPRPSSPGSITGFRQVDKPCGDCIDNWCQMNCGPALGRSPLTGEAS